MDKRPLYCAKLPLGWTYSVSNAADTTKAIAEFYDPTGAIRFTFHNFPENRIPPMAQVMRWRKQIEHLNPATMSVKPQAFSGFVGYLFEGTGDQQTVLAWAMEIAPEHLPHVASNEMGASFTLKAVGPIEAMAKEKYTIIAFARSFGLIDEIPSE